MKKSKVISLFAVLAISSLLSADLIARGGGGGHGGGGHGGGHGGRGYGHGYGRGYGRGGWGRGGYGYYGRRGVGWGVAGGLVAGEAIAASNRPNVVYVGDSYDDDHGPDYDTIEYVD